MELRHPQPIENGPLVEAERAAPRAGPGQLRVHVQACAVCHTDLHLAEGDLPAEHLPLVLGHQVVGLVSEVGEGVQGWKLGDRLGIPWLHQTDESCEACQRGEENLCPRATFTGWQADGGFAEETVAEADFAIPLPGPRAADSLAPLLCAGIIGYRSLKKADLHPGERLGLVGFGSSAHLALPLARHWGCQVAVFTRSPVHRSLARDLGANWVGGVEDEAPWPLDRAVLFAPSGDLVPILLAKLRPGGTLAINAIHLRPIPSLPYSALYGERTLRSVTNATRQDAKEFLRWADVVPLRPTVQRYPLAAANRALSELKDSQVAGAAVLLP